MGQRRKSTTEHELAGTFRPDRHGTTQATGETLKALPAPPFTLPTLAKKIYQVEGRNLIDLGLLKNSDLIALAQYANETAVYIQASKEASAGGLVVELSNGMPAQNGFRKIAEQALKNSMALADRLGLSPKGRFAMKGPGAFESGDGKPEDPFLAVLALMNQNKPK